ncbi:MAG: hypothetical protein JRH20_13265 [Deltaproteobacteria bacterium]|nr:hypothetical protein [Deltaproteobacteria bacterium]
MARRKERRILFGMRATKQRRQREIDLEGVVARSKERRILFGMRATKQRRQRTF